MKNSGFAHVVLILGILILGFIALRYILNINSSTDSFPLKTNLAIATSTPQPSPAESKVDTTSWKLYTYKTFSIHYPRTWVLNENKTSNTMRLENVLDRLYDHVFSLSKNGVYLFVGVELNPKGYAGGIFSNQAEYTSYVSQRDMLEISGQTFYLSRESRNLTELLKSESGPYTWTVLSEYLPNKELFGGTHARGYTDVISRDGKSYSFILVSENGGKTNSETQNDLVNILNTIRW